MARICRVPGLRGQLTALLSLMVVAAPQGQSQPPGAVVTPIAWRDQAPARASEDWAAVLTDHGRLPKRERLVVLDASGRELARVDGSERAVPVPADLAERLCSEALNATLVHNHPELAGFSAADLDVLGHVGVRRVVAVSADGTTFEAAAGPHFAESWAVAMRRDLPARLAARVQAESWRRGLPADALAPHEAHVAALVLARLGVIDYRVSPSLTARLAFDRYREVFARVVTTESASAAAPATASR
jgi:hypothetical protein